MDGSFFFLKDVPEDVGESQCGFYEAERMRSRDVFDELHHDSNCTLTAVAIFTAREMCLL